MLKCCTLHFEYITLTEYYYVRWMKRLAQGANGSNAAEYIVKMRRKSTGTQTVTCRTIRTMFSKVWSQLRYNFFFFFFVCFVRWWCCLCNSIWIKSMNKHGIRRLWMECTAEQMLETMLCSLFYWHNEIKTRQILTTSHFHRLHSLNL